MAFSNHKLRKRNIESLNINTLYNNPFRILACYAQSEMHQFLNLNRHKLAFAFKATSLTFLTLWSAVFIIAYINGQKVDVDLIILVVFLFGVALPCFIIFISYLAWYYKEWTKRKAFSKSPFNQIHELGFSNLLVNEKSKWFFSEEIKAGKVNGFNVIADTLYDKGHIIEVQALPASRQMDKNEYKRLKKEFKAHDIDFDIGSLVKKYNTRHLSVITISDLERDLKEFTGLLKQNGFEPQLQHDWA